jgi:tRNA pseudouridine synthase 10
MGKFQICENCFLSQIGISISTQESVTECYICRGLWNKMDSIASEVHFSSRMHDFRSFLIGLVLPWQICENEDQIRASCKIRGRESIKTALTRVIRQRFAKLSGKRLETNNPDVVIIITVQDKNYVDLGITVRSRSLTLGGVYVKKSRDVPLYESRLSIYPKKKVSSFEEVLRRELIYATDAESVSFSWMGKEDRDSLVLGGGRPFFATLKNPKRRYLKHHLRFQIGKTSVTVNKHPTNIPRQLPTFINKIRAVVASEYNEQFSSSDMRVLNNKGILCVAFANKKSLAIKLIYSMRARVVNVRKFVLTIVCDGGLPIKRFVDGYGRTSPNVTDLLKKKCKCHIFDVMDLHVQDRFSIASNLKLNNLEI